MASTLADTFLDDLDDLNDSDEDIGTTNPNDLTSNNNNDNNNKKDDDDDDDDGIEMNDDNFDEKLVNLVVAKVANSVGNLRKSSIYINILSKVKFELETNNNDAKIGNLEDDSDYKLILTCNKMISDIDLEILSTHQYVVDIYSSKFPELEGLIPNKLEYINTVNRIGNEIDMTMVELGDILSSSTVMIVSVTGSITSGKPLSENQLSEVQNGCEEVLKLYDDKNIILKYVENRMNKISPNLCNLIGSRVAAQIVGIAGGLISLSKIPSCNIQVLGQEKLNGNGLSNIGVLKHTGALFMCELVRHIYLTMNLSIYLSIIFISNFLSVYL
jgi:U4/U6 small nuclear ribonucleoprotein PRP31